MASAETSVVEVQNLIGGCLTSAQSDQFDDVYNPSTGQSIARVPLSSAVDIDAAVAAAREALPAWSRMPIVERARVFFRYRELLETHFDSLSQLITREHGKTRAESKAELRRGIEVVEFACGIPSLFMGTALADLATDVDADLMRHPVGVCVGITPYNFPAMVPLWMFPIALMCGNTFVLKPSEKVPLTVMRLGQLLLEAGLPPGAFSIVHGGRECAEACLDHPHVAALSFVGSTAVAREVYRRGTAAGKRVQAAGGAKNHFIILPDADPDLTVKALAAAAFGCGGQRCMAVSVAVPVGGTADNFVERLAEHAAGLRVGPTDGEGHVDIGPLIRAEHVAHVADYLHTAQGEGAVIALDGRQSFGGTGFFLGPSVVDRVRTDMTVASEEVFGPLLSVMRADSLEAAVELSHHSDFGNGASIFTNDGAAARYFKQHVNAGMIGINVGVPAPMAWFPFTGWNASFFGDLHVQGTEGVQFYTRQKVTMTRWPRGDHSTHRDPIWRP